MDFETTLCVSWVFNSHVRVGKVSTFFLETGLPRARIIDYGTSLSEENRSQTTCKKIKKSIGFGSTGSLWYNGSSD